jgi:hypothetical protein
LYFWRIYEMGFPEGSNVKAPRGFRFSLWSLSSLPLSNYPLFTNPLLIIKLKKEETIMAGLGSRVGYPGGGRDNELQVLHLGD